VSGGSVVAAPGVELRYEIHGEGRPVLLIAGLADDSSSWGAQVEALAPKRRVVCFDNRGCGRSSTPPGPYSTREMAADAHAVIAALGLAPVDVVGSSMGGAIAEWLAIDHPGDVDRLLLTNSWGGPEPYLEWLFDFWDELAADPPRLAEVGRLFSFSPAFIGQHTERVLELTTGPPPEIAGFRAALAACRGHDALDRLGEIRHPTCVVAASADIVTPPRLSTALAESISSAELRTVESGHMICWERPDALNAILLEFFDG